MRQTISTIILLLTLCKLSLAQSISINKKIEHELIILKLTNTNEWNNKDIKINDCLKANPENKNHGTVIYSRPIKQSRIEINLSSCSDDTCKNNITVYNSNNEVEEDFEIIKKQSMSEGTDILAVVGKKMKETDKYSYPALLRILLPLKENGEIESVAICTETLSKEIIIVKLYILE